MNDPQRNEYLALINQIADLQRRKNKLEKERQKYRERSYVIRSELILEIGLVKDEKGKLIYSNEHLREAKLVVEIDRNEEVLKLRERSRGIDEEVGEIIVDYNSLIDKKYLLMIELGISVDAEGKQYPNVQ